MIDLLDGMDGFSWSRVSAIVLRYWYLLRASWPRLFELMYWPTIQMVLWGFLSMFLTTQSGVLAQAAGILIGAFLLWDIVFRAQLGVSLGFLEEVWSRNFSSLFVSPLRIYEWMTSLMVMSLIRTAIGMTPAILLALILYHYNLFDLGLPVVGFMLGLIMMGWWLGFFAIAVIIRHGMGAEILAWMMVFLLAPISAVYYPVSTLPEWLQPVALLVPATHIFEGMRAVMFQHHFDSHFLVSAFALNIFYLALSWLYFLWSFRRARHAGGLIQMGE
jgi:ABC-2 type transport system permease protein